MALSHTRGRDQVRLNKAFVKLPESLSYSCLLQFRAGLLAVGLPEEERPGEEDRCEVIFGNIKKCVVWASELSARLCSGWFPAASERRRRQLLHRLHRPLHVRAAVPGCRGRQ